MDFDLDNKIKLTIGRLARESGLSVTTVRYYQRRGLLRRPERPATGSFRSYNGRDLERLNLIRQSQELGFTLAEISELIAFIEKGECREVRSLASEKLTAIKAQIRRLESTGKMLSLLLTRCDGACNGSCTLIEALRSPEPIAGNGKSHKLSV